jgi:enoyl-CoA hydratase/carnithine racemase
VGARVILAAAILKRGEMQEIGDDILTEVDAAGIATVTLNRAKKRNALTLAMWRRLGDVFADVGRRADVRVVILTGTGGNFSAGADIVEFAQVRNTVEAGRSYEAATEAATLAVRDCPKPTIAAVCGFGVGGGCGIALACDVRVGDQTTRMGIPAAKLGIVYGPLDCDLLLRQVGLANAKLVLFSGRLFGLDDCLRMRLLDVAGETSALESARTLARDLAANAPISLKGAKLVLEALARGAAKEQAHDIEEVIDEALTSEDYREAARAFVAKRKPVFRGK